MTASVLTRTSLPADSTGKRMGWDPADLAMAMLLLSTCAIRPRWFGLVAVADVILVVNIAVLVVVLMLRAQRNESDPIAALLPPLWGLAVLEVFATLLADNQSSAVLDALKDVWSMGFLVVPILLLGGRSIAELPLTRFAAAAGVVAVSVWVILQPGSRPAGPFPDPTYTGSWIAMGTLLCAVFRIRVVLLVPLLGIAAVGLIRVQSFAALGSLAAGLFLLWVIRRRLLRMAVVLGAAAVGALLPVVGSRAVGWVASQYGSAPAGSALWHLQMTTSIRWSIWEDAWRLVQDNPLGIGPGQFSNRAYYLTTSGVGYETHNTFLELAVELGWLAIPLCFWLLARLTASGAAAASALVIALVSESTFHNAVNFRHVWVMVAIAFVVSSIQERSSPPDRITMDQVPGER